MADLRHAEILRVHKSLGRLCNADRKWWQFWRRLEWDKIFGTLAILFWGGFIAGLIAMVPFLDADPTTVAKREYYWLIGITGGVAAGLSIARFAIKTKEIESVTTVYEYVDEIVARRRDD